MRFGNSPNYDPYKCFMSVDGTEFMIYLPYPVRNMCYSHKFMDPVLRYELYVAVFSNEMISASGS